MKNGFKEGYISKSTMRSIVSIFAVIMICTTILNIVYNVNALQVFFDDMESGINGWTYDGLWHQTDDRYNSFNTSWVYNDGTDYNTSSQNNGSLTSPVIDLNTPDFANLTFWTWHITEGDWVFDQMWVQISEDGGPFLNEYQINPLAPFQAKWIEININISSHVGHDIQIRFFFDTMDDTQNNYEGWYIDDVEVNDNLVTTFFPPHSDEGQDTDSDSLFNYLVVNVKVNVSRAGSYRVEGALFNVSLGFIETVDNFTFLNTGIQEVKLFFNGSAIYNNGANGSFVVLLDLYDNSSNLLDSDVNITGVYTYDEFQPPPLTPWATASGPTSSGTNNASPNIAYSYGEGPTSVEIYWTDDGGSSWTLWGIDPTVDGTWSPGSPLPASGTYDWSVRAIGAPNESVPTGPGDIEAGSYILDIDAPSIFLTTPLDGEIDVSTAAGTYVIQFNELMDKVGTPLYDLPIVGWSWDTTGRWLNGTYNPLNPITIYYVDLAGQGFQDLVGNALSGDMYMDFTTGAPWATITDPTSPGTNNATPTITYNFGNSPTSVEIYWTDDGGSSWTLWGTDTSVDGSWPAGSPLPASGTYDWSARGIGAADEPVPTGPGDIEAGSYILDIDAPTISSTIPIDGTNTVPVDQDIIITFSEPIDNATWAYNCSPDPAGWSELWNATNEKVTLTHSSFGLDITYIFTVIWANDTVGNALVAGPVPNPFDFTTVFPPPWATAKDPTSSATNNATPTITYNFGNSPTSVEIYWTDDGGSSWTLWGTDSSVVGSWPATSSLPASGTYDWCARAMGTTNETVPNAPGDIEAGSYILDIDAPTISSTIPSDGTNTVPIDQDIIITFSEPIDNATWAYNCSPDPAGWSELWNATNEKVTLTHTSFGLDITYLFTVIWANDSVGNALVAGPVPNPFDFTTVSPDPYATATGPTSLGTNNATPTITYDFGNSPTSVEIYWSDDGGTSWTLWGIDSTVDGSWPAVSSLSASGTYDWSVRAIGAKNESIPSGPGDIEAGSYVLDIDPPTIFSTTPIDGETDVSIAAGTYIIEFSEPMAPVGMPDTDLPDIMWIGDVSGLWLNGTYTALAPGTTYYVDLTGLGFQDKAGNALTGDMYKNFTTIAAANPWAKATGPISGLTNNATPTITYDFVNAPTSVEIYWSDDGGASWTLWGTDTSVDGSWPAVSPLSGSGTYDWSVRAIGATNESVPSAPADIEAGLYNLDIDAPTIFSTTPIDGENGVSKSAGTYVIEFSEPMNPVVTPLTNLPIIIWNWDSSGLWLNGTYTALSPGTTYNVNLTGLGFQDLAGNALTGDINLEFTTATGPWATATGPISLGTNDVNPTIKYDIGDGPTSVEIYWTDDGGSSWTFWGTDASVDGSWPAVSPLSASGTYDWSVRALGTTDEPVPSGPGDIEAGSYILDIDPPTISSTIPVDGTGSVSISQNIIITFSESIDKATWAYTCNPDPGGWNEFWNPTNDTVTLTHTSFDLITPYTFTVIWANDSVGNALVAGPVPNPFDFTTEIMDTTPPTIESITLSDPSPTKAGTVTFTITFSETMNNSVSPLVTFGLSSPYDTYTISEISYSENIWTGNFIIDALTGDGINNISVSLAEDLAGNQMAIDTSHTFVIDTIPPTILSITLSDPSPTKAGTVVFTITFDEDMDPGVSPMVTFGLSSPFDAHMITETSYIGDSWIGTFTINATTGDGINNISVSLAEDLAGNQMVIDTSHSFVIDTTSPTILSIDLSTPSPLKAGAVTFTISFSETMSTSISPLVTFGLTSPFDTHVITETSYIGDTWIGTFTIDAATGDGVNNISVSLAEDLAGNQMATDTSYNFEIDASAPTSSVDNLPQYQNDLIFDVPYTADDDGSGVQYVELYYRADGIDWTKYGATFTSSPISFTASSEGLYEFYTIATDYAGNIESAPSLPPDASTFVDITLPTILSIELSEQSPIKAGPVFFTITFSEYMNISVLPVVTFGLDSPYNTHTINAISYFEDAWVGSFTINSNTGDGINNISVSLAKDIAGNQMGVDTSHTFVIDTTPPTIIVNTPTGEGVSLTTTISITFSESMDNSSVESAFSYTDRTTIWTFADGLISWNVNTMIFTPNSDLSYNTEYNVTISTEAKDMAENGLALPYTWSFTTLQGPDITSPFVESVSVTGTDVDVSTTLSITFNEPMDQTSVENSVTISPFITISDYSWVGNTLMITFESDLEYDTQYTVMIGPGARDLAGNVIEDPYSWPFTTTKAKLEDDGFLVNYWWIILVIIIVVVVLLVLMLIRGGAEEEELPGPIAEMEEEKVEEPEEEVEEAEEPVEEVEEPLEEIEEVEEPVEEVEEPLEEAEEIEEPLEEVEELLKEVEEVVPPIPEEELVEEILFKCPMCGTMVKSDATKCPGCGALFETMEEEEAPPAEEEAEEIEFDCPECGALIKLDLSLDAGECPVCGVEFEVEDLEEDEE